MSENRVYVRSIQKKTGLKYVKKIVEKEVKCSLVVVLFGDAT